jgi:hypothetical protein
MSDWTYVLSRKEAREEKIRQVTQKNEQRLLHEYTERNKSIVDYSTLVDKSGVPNPVSMGSINWPSIAKNPDSPLLSETVGSTDGTVLVERVYLESYTKFKNILSKYTVPIYHIDYEEHTDMGYDSKGRRAPYVESITVSVWTFAAANVPVIHVYEIDVDRYSRKGSHNEGTCSYKYSYSPVNYAIDNENDHDYDYYTIKPCVLRMIAL